MSSLAHLNYFDIQSCGLYRHGSNTPEGIETYETFKLIYEWVRGKPLCDTIPWDPSSKRSSEVKCYCHDIYSCEDSGEFLLVLWKSDADSAGTIWGAPENAQTGSTGRVVEYTNNHKGEKVIWGRPCYYWIIPSLSLVVSIKVDNSVCDSAMFQDWVSKCITNRVRHDNKTVTHTENGYARFTFDGSDSSEYAKYQYKFDVKLRSINTASTEMRDLASKVTHIIRRETIVLPRGKDDRAEWIKIFDSIPFLAAKPKSKTRLIELKAEAKPTASEIKKIIEDFSKENRKRGEWNNVGFETTAGTVVWVDKYRLHECISMSKGANPIFNAAEVHERLSKDRNRLLGTILRDEAKRSKLKRHGSQ